MLQEFSERYTIPVITTDESYQHLDLKIILFKTILFKTEGLLGDQTFHFFWQMNALVVKFQIILRNAVTKRDFHHTKYEILAMF